MNAVDGDPGTYALTETEKNPWLTVTLSDIFTIKGIHLILQKGKVYKKKIYLSIYLVILYHHFFLQISLPGVLFTSETQL